MASAKITLIGLDAYTDGAIWSGLSLPEYFDKDTAVSTILLNCGEQEVIYPDPIALTNFIRIWSNKYQRFFERLAAAMQEDYKPLANYDRYEEWEDHEKGAGTVKDTDKLVHGSVTTGDSHTTDFARIESEETGSNEDTTTNTVSAFNSNTYQPRDQSTNEGETTVNKEGTEDRNIDVSSGSKTDATDNRTYDGLSNTQVDSDHKGHMWGNIGVTTTQKILREEIAVSAISPYDIISDVFANEFSIRVYV